MESKTSVTWYFAPSSATNKLTTDGRLTIRLEIIRNANSAFELIFIVL